MASLAPPGRGESNSRLRPLCEAVLGVAIATFSGGDALAPSLSSASEPPTPSAPTSGGPSSPNADSPTGGAIKMTAPRLVSTAKEISNEPMPEAPAESALDAAKLPGANALRMEPPLQTRYLFGGGRANHAGLQAFWRSAGGEESNILVIGWGSTVANDYYQTFLNDLLAAVNTLRGTEEGESVPPIQVRKMPDLVDLNGNFESARELVRESTAVFILGGDQVPLMRALNTTGVQTLLKELLAEAKIVLGGTSAGTAIASHTMIGGYDLPATRAADELFVSIPHTRKNERGEEEEHPFFIGEGLGILPHDVVIEQHLARRGRFERLCRVVEAVPHISWGIGVEDSTTAVWDGVGSIKAVGPGHVVIVRKNEDGGVEKVATLTDGQQYSLTE